MEANGPPKEAKSRTTREMADAARDMVRVLPGPHIGAFVPCSNVALERQQFAVACIDDANRRDAERTTHRNTEVAVDDHRAVHGDFWVLRTEVVDVLGRAIRRDDDEAGFTRGTCIEGLSLTEQESASGGCGLEVSA